MGKCEAKNLLFRCTEDQLVIRIYSQKFDTSFNCNEPMNINAKFSNGHAIHELSFINIIWNLIFIVMQLSDSLYPSSILRHECLLSFEFLIQSKYFSKTVKKKYTSIFRLVLPLSYDYARYDFWARIHGYSALCSLFRMMVIEIIVCLKLFMCWCRLTLTIHIYIAYELQKKRL